MKTLIGAMFAALVLAAGAPASARPYLPQRDAKAALRLGFSDYVQMTDGRVVIGRCTHKARGHLWRTAVRCRVTLRGGSSPAQYRSVVRMKPDGYYLTARRLR
jgi:hypothetical protein